MRLTKYHKEQIKRRLLKERFEKRRGHISEMEARLGMSIYRAAFTPKEREQLESLPHGWVPRVEQLAASFRGKVSRFTVPTSVPVPHSRVDKWDGPLPLIVVDKREHRRLLERYEAIEELRRTADSALEEAAREITTVLAGITTTGRLKEHWPEIADLVDEVAPERGTSRALVVSAKRANILLGLAPDEGEGAEVVSFGA